MCKREHIHADDSDIRGYYEYMDTMDWEDGEGNQIESIGAHFRTWLKYHAGEYAEDMEEEQEARETDRADQITGHEQQIQELMSLPDWDDIRAGFYVVTEKETGSETDHGVADYILCIYGDISDSSGENRVKYMNDVERHKEEQAKRELRQILREVFEKHAEDDFMSAIMFGFDLREAHGLDVPVSARKCLERFRDEYSKKDWNSIYQLAEFTFGTETYTETVEYLRNYI